MDKILIVGLGVGGTLLAEALRLRKVEVHVVDVPLPGAASRVAPGIMNPLAGKKLRPSWQVREHLITARQAYQSLEEKLGQTFLHSTPILRIIRDAKQESAFAERLAEPECLPLIGERHFPNTFAPAVDDRHGSFEAADSGWVDALALVDAYRELLRAEGRLEERTFDPGSVEPLHSGARALGETWSCIVFAEGWRARENPWFRYLPHNPARGEMLDLRADSGSPSWDRILNFGKWLLPLSDGTFRAGATYSWSDFEAPPSAAAREEILRALSERTTFRFTVTGQRFGVRPILRDYFPVAGRHPHHPRLAILNGFGSKGVLTAPWVARKLANHLLDNLPVPAPVSIDRFRPPTRTA